MGVINSPLGQQNFESSTTRSFTVDDRSQDDFDLPPAQPRPPQFQHAVQQQRQSEPQPPRMTADEIMEMRRRKIAEAQGVSGDARQRLNLLLGIGRATKNVSIESDSGTVTYSLRTLKGREQEHIVSLAELADKEKTVKSTFPIRNTTIAYALYAIDNIDLDLLLGATGHSLQDQIAMRTAFVEEMDDHVVRYLFDQHQELVQENLVRFQSPEDVKEVAEQIKKSSGGTGS
jgi:hypothetical protein